MWPSLSQFRILLLLFLIIYSTYANFCGLKKVIVSKSLQMYIKHSKIMVSTSLLTDSESTAVDSDPPYSISLPTVPWFSTVEMDTSASLDLDHPIAHWKDKMILYSVSYF